MTSDNIERILNIDLVLQRIVGYLEPRDLRAAVLVSRFISEQLSVSERLFYFRTWESLLARRECWAWAKVNLTDENVCSIVQSDRINLVGVINIQRSTASPLAVETLLRFLSTCSQLKVRKISVNGGLDLSFLPPDILSESLVRKGVTLKKNISVFFNAQNDQFLQYI